MNYIIQFNISSNVPRFLADNNIVTDKLTEALIFPTAQTAGIYLDNYMEDTGEYDSGAIIRPTGL